MRWGRNTVGVSSRRLSVCAFFSTSLVWRCFGGYSIKLIDIIKIKIET